MGRGAEILSPPRAFLTQRYDRSNRVPSNEGDLRDEDDEEEEEDEGLLCPYDRVITVDDVSFVSPQGLQRVVGGVRDGGGRVKCCWPVLRGCTVYPLPAMQLHITESPRQTALGEEDHSGRRNLGNDKTEPGLRIAA
ncbi:hypothetical protein CRUP_004887 [Coryphaenoides rupestris]|nr:hypothetical protein CRUP_004887 [Coryphaenoides rupestris]